MRGGPSWVPPGSLLGPSHTAGLTSQRSASWLDVLEDAADAASAAALAEDGPGEPEDADEEDPGRGEEEDDEEELPMGPARASRAVTCSIISSLRCTATVPGPGPGSTNQRGAVHSLQKGRDASDAAGPNATRHTLPP